MTIKAVKTSPDMVRKILDVLVLIVQFSVFFCCFFFAGKDDQARDGGGIFGAQSVAGQ